MIGLQCFGRYEIYFSSIIHALALIFFRSLIYLILEKKDKSLSEEFIMVLRLEKISLLEIFDLTSKEFFSSICFISINLIFFKVFKFQIYF